MIRALSFMHAESKLPSKHHAPGQHEGFVYFCTQHATSTGWLLLLASGGISLCLIVYITPAISLPRRSMRLSNSPSSSRLTRFMSPQKDSGADSIVANC